MRLSKLTRGVLAAALLITVAVVGAAPGTVPRTRVRFINAVPGLTRVDMRLNDSVVFGQTPYSVVTGFQNVTAATYSMDVTTLRAQTTVIPPEDTDLDDTDEDYTILCCGSVSGNPALQALNLEWGRVAVPRNEADIVFIHASPDAGAVDVFIDGALVETGMPFTDFNGPSAYGPGQHTVDVQIAGVSIATSTFRLQGGTTNTILFTGTKATNDGFPLLLKNFSSR